MNQKEIEGVVSRLISINDWSKLKDVVLSIGVTFYKDETTIINVNSRDVRTERGRAISNQFSHIEDVKGFYKELEKNIDKLIDERANTKLERIEELENELKELKGDN